MRVCALVLLCVATVARGEPWILPSLGAAVGGHSGAEGRGFGLTGILFGGVAFWRPVGFTHSGWEGMWTVEASAQLLLSEAPRGAATVAVGYAPSEKLPAISLGVGIEREIARAAAFEPIGTITVGAEVMFFCALISPISDRPAVHLVLGVDPVKWLSMLALMRSC